MAATVRQKRAQRRYAPKGAIDRAVEAMRANGIRVRSVTISPDGSIKLSSIDDRETKSDSVFDALERAGRL